MLPPVTVNKLPRAAQVYLLSVTLLGLLCAIRVAPSFEREFIGKPQIVCLLILFAIFGGAKKITIPTKILNSEGTSMTLGFGIALAALISCGPATGVYVSVVGCLAGSLYPHRHRFHQMAFNVSLAAVEAFTGQYVYKSLHGTALLSNSALFFCVVIVSAVAYFLVNTVGVSIILGLASAESPISVWKENFIWSAPGYIATAAITGFATVILRGSNAGLVLFLLPVVYLFFQIATSYQKRLQQQKEIQEGQEHLAGLYLSTIKSLALAIDAKDQYTHQHIIRVQRYAVAVAKEMGLQGPELEAVNTGALLHDIGKIGVPEYVLMKPGRLTPGEFDKIKKHPEIGAAILDPVEFPWPVLPVVRSHHEKWNGTGYPDGLKGEEIPLTARIMAVADVYDALTSTRSYRTAWSHERAVGVIQKDSGTHFDPLVVEAFQRVIDQVVTEMAEVGEGPLAPKIIPAASPASKTAQAANEISRTSTEVYALYEVVRTLNAGMEPDDLISFICKKLEHIYPGALFAILIRDGSGDGLRVHSAQGPNAGFFIGARPHHDQSLTSKSLEDAKTYHGGYDQEDMQLTVIEGSEWIPLQSQIVVPLIFEGKGIGLINCYHPDFDVFSEQDVLVMETVAQHTSEALYNGFLSSRMQGDGHVDPLTGTLSVRCLADTVEAICQRDGPSALQNFWLLFIDIDEFRSLNQIFGHEKGDIVLKDFADILTSCVGPGEKVARYGPDQFLILIDVDSDDQFTKARKRIEDALRDYKTDLWHTQLGNVRVSATTGWAKFPENGTSFGALFVAAERDLQSKKAVKRLAASKFATTLGVSEAA